MEQTPLPTLQQLQQKINRNINDATQRYQTAISNRNAMPDSLQPIMHPADTFFAPPAANPRITTCLVCNAPFENHVELCHHVELHHPTLYNPPHVPMPLGNPQSPFAVPGSVFPLNSLQIPPVTNPWTPANSSVPPAQHSITAPHSKKLAQPFRCNICDIGCDTMAILNTHLGGQKHRKKLELREAFQKAAPNLEAEGIVEVNPRLWVCKLCTTGMDSENAVLQHLVATKHKRLRQTLSQNEQHKRLRKYPVTALQAAESVASTPVSAALAVLKDDSVTLPPVSSLFTAPLPLASHPVPSPPASSAAPKRYVQPDRHTPIPPLTQPPLTQPSQTQPSQPGAPRSSITKSPRPPPTNTSNRQTGPSFSCSICSVTCNSMDSLNSHLASIRHKRKQSMVEASSDPSAQVSVPSQMIRCVVCDVMTCGQLNFEAHLNGKNHLKKLRTLGQQPPSGAAASTGSPSASPMPTPPHNPQVTVTAAIDRPFPVQPPVQPSLSARTKSSSPSHSALGSTDTPHRVSS